jgi:hypothetical protein
MHMMRLTLSCVILSVHHESLAEYSTLQIGRGRMPTFADRPHLPYLEV